MTDRARSNSNDESSLVKPEDGERLGTFIVDWLADQLQASHMGGLVVGLSGGIDSAVVAGLSRLAVSRTGKHLLAVLMPCHSVPQDEADARLVADHFGLEMVRVDLAPVYDLLLTTFRAADPHKAYSDDAQSLAQANLKPRLRMLTLYYLANRRQALVVGTGNRSELAVGYFTKYGDGGVDLLPLGSLVKAQVRAVARWLGVPQPILDKAPSAGLWEGQTDEGEMGLTYAILDAYLLGRPVDEAAKARIEALHARSEHKRRPTPICPLPPEYQ